MDIEHEIRLGEAEAKFSAQQHSKRVAEVEVLRCKKRIIDLEATVVNLTGEIEKTLSAISEIKKEISEV